ncbi:MULTISPECIES: nucleoside triphosphate pyrophosphohydrolase [Pseudothermotoga]|uniref:MazG family protein n=1 Tax=Pseudothermotoga lettingae (strain ATCC BAA-301 / DSM 14385 / NBRC 107922 / TMO) TaxID=416591 RepID=A8F3A5_PSELT|nr:MULTISPECIES: nucleoside triphosphate pyrophosphohydrolase [Pseudothermotoga]ABV32639.1 MazG family protein [Pseudothermotoga lettingae TMO]KUK20486.1 MAG: MazG family protein [Pseudothermotoga lettingae]MDK2885102.1 tetrapyrrole methylase family protein / MazG family protein [Pseudothermotoga sp.]GLI48370.1 nucleoside triphosphate pyrophosphohydrolase/pyrophosphatase MazG [Pseudothermotoga lettingae TMO]HBT26043.1 nucleoside triphosphate pyrophosphohydrolase [Pseudothermotoga sp.]
MSEIGEQFQKLVSIMQKLRSPDGCEWDREQTHHSLKPYLVEEVFELIEAIDQSEDEKLKEELGDVLLQVIFHCQIASERGAFNISDVVTFLSEKLVRRHPHVFSDSPGYSYEQWERIKSSEKGEQKSSAIGRLNHALPALSLARRIQENAAAVGFDWPDISGAMEKVKEEVGELEDAIKSEGRQELEEELGDLLFAVVNIARFLQLDPEIALRKSTRKFVERFQMVEEFVRERKLDLKKLSLDQLDELWEEAKGGKIK